MIKLLVFWLQLLWHSALPDVLFYCLRGFTFSFRHGLSLFLLDSSVSCSLLLSPSLVLLAVYHHLPHDLDTKKGIKMRKRKLLTLILDIVPL